MPVFAISKDRVLAATDMVSIARKCRNLLRYNVKRRGNFKLVILNPDGFKFGGGGFNRHPEKNLVIYP